jgi:hypothetical protein
LLCFLQVAILHNRRLMAWANLADRPAGETATLRNSLVYVRKNLSFSNFSSPDQTV